MELRINKSFAIYALLLLLYFRPAQYVLGDLLYDLTNWMLLALFLALFIYRFFIMRKVNKDLLWLIIAYTWCMMGSTIINYSMGNKVSFPQAILYFSIICGVILLSDIGLKKNPKIFFQSFSVVGSIMCVLNSFTFFLYADKGGMSTLRVDVLTGRNLSSNYFLFAEDNATFFWTWPVLVIMWLNLFMYNRKRSYITWVVFATSFIVVSYVYVWSVTAMLVFLSIGIVALVYLFRMRRSKRRRLGSYRVTHKGQWSLFHVLFLISIVITALVVVFQIYVYFSDFLETYLNKTATLSSRSAIWNKSIYYIKKSFLIGYGYESRDVSVMKLVRFNHTHNMWLEILYRGGIIGAILFFVSFWLCGKENHKNNIVLDRRKRSALNFVYLSIFLFFMFTLLEFAFYRYMYVVLFVVLIHKEIFLSSSTRPA